MSNLSINVDINYEAIVIFDINMAEVNNLVVTLIAVMSP